MEPDWHFSLTTLTKYKNTMYNEILLKHYNFPFITTVNRHIAENSIWTKCRNSFQVFLPNFFSKKGVLVQSVEICLIIKSTLLRFLFFIFCLFLCSYYMFNYIYLRSKQNYHLTTIKLNSWHLNACHAHVLFMLMYLDKCTILVY